VVQGESEYDEARSGSGGGRFPSAPLCAVGVGHDQGSDLTKSALLG